MYIYTCIFILSDVYYRNRMYMLVFLQSSKQMFMQKSQIVQIGITGDEYQAICSSLNAFIIMLLTLIVSGANMT